MSDVPKEADEDQGSADLSNSAPSPSEHEDPNAVALNAAESSTNVASLSAQDASQDAATSSSGESSAEPLTLEQRIEQRFIGIEQAILNLPHAIAFANNHPDPADWCRSVLYHLFNKKQ